MTSRKDIRIIFMGTPEFAVASLDKLVSEGYQVVAVVTQPDKPVGRHGSVLQPSPMKRYAIERNIPVLQPIKMSDPEFIAQLKTFEADLQVVVAFRILPETVWSMPCLGTFNVHASLLPQYRGAAPINWAIINGETKTGVTTFFLDKNIDTGSIILSEETAIPEDADVETMYDKLMVMGAELCLKTTNLIVETDGNIATTIQPHSETLHDAPKLNKTNCKIDWSKTAVEIYNFVRGLCPIPSAWTVLQKSDLSTTDIKIFKTAVTQQPCNCLPGTVIAEGNKMLVATADNWIEIIELQPSGKKRMAASAFMNGLQQKLGLMFLYN